MDAPEAILLDVYETVLTCDFERHFHGLADAAGVEFAAWSAALEQFVPALVRGHLTIVEAFRQTLVACGAAPSRAPEIAGRDVELIVECSTLFPDVLPSIRFWQSLGTEVALVSNCVPNTRPLLQALGLLNVVDATVLSCEVGSTKPEREIYVHAAAAVGVAPQSAIFVDDQLRFCDGAEAVGMRAVLIDRTGVAPAPQGRRLTISSLTELGRDWAARR